LVLKEVLQQIANVLLETLNSMNNHGINIVIVNHGMVIIQIILIIFVLNKLVLLNAWNSVTLVLMLILVINVLLDIFGIITITCVNT